MYKTAVVRARYEPTQGPARSRADSSVRYLGAAANERNPAPELQTAELQTAELLSSAVVAAARTNPAVTHGPWRAERGGLVLPCCRSGRGVRQRRGGRREWLLVAWPCAWGLKAGLAHATSHPCSPLTRSPWPAAAPSPASMPRAAASAAARTTPRTQTDRAWCCPTRPRPRPGPWRRGAGRRRRHRR